MALITGVVTVTQDPSSAGTMWRTVSARIRGAKLELEELGEEQDKYTKSTSTMRDLIKTTTGFDIMADEAGTRFKDIYDIIVGIGEKWSELTDIERAGLLEAIGGKRAQNQLSAVLNNIELVKNAYTSAATESEGSAMKENEAYMDSVQAKINQTKAQIQELATDFLSSDLLKGLIDAARTFLGIVDQIVDRLGTLWTTMVGLGAGSLFKGLVLKQDSLVTGFFKSIAGIGANKAIAADFAESFNKTIQTVGMEGGIELLKNYGDINNAADLLSNVDIKDSQKLELLSKAFGVTAEQASKAGTAVTQTANSITGISRIDGAINAVKNFGTGLAGLVVSHPIISALAAGLTILTAVYATNIKKQRELIEGAKEGAKSWESQKSSLEGYINKYKELREKLDSGDLSEEETLNVKQQLLELQQQITSEYGNAANGVNLVNGALEQQLGILQQIAMEQAETNLRENMNNYRGALSQMYQTGSKYINYGPEGYSQGIRDRVKEYIEQVDGIMFAEVEGHEWDQIVYAPDLDATEAKEKVKDVLDYLHSLESEMASELKDSPASQEMLQNYIDSFFGEYNKFGAISDSLEPLRKAALDALVTSVGGSDAAKEVKDASKALNDAILSGESDAIDENIKRRHTALLNYKDYIQQAIDSDYGKQIPNLGIDDFLSSIDDLSSFDEKALQLHDFSKIMKGMLSGFDLKGISKDSIESLKGIKDAALDIVDVRNIFEQGRPFEVDILSGSATKSVESSLYDLAEAFGVVFEDNIPKDQVVFENFLSALTASGAVFDATGASIDSVKESVSGTEETLRKATAAVSSLTTIMSESVSGTGVSEENLKTFKAMFGDDAEKAIERTENGIHLNRQAVQELQEQYAKKTKSEYLATLDEQYRLLTEAKDAIDKRASENKDTSALEARRDAIQKEITSLKDLVAQYDGATSAFNRWTQAQSGGNENDMYTKAFGAYDDYKKQLDNGWLNNGIREWVHMMTGMRNSSVASYEEISEAFRNMKKNLTDSRFSLMDFYDVEDSQVTVDGLQNFFTAVNETFGEEFATIENGEWKIKFTDGNVEAMTEKWDIGSELIELIMRSAIDAGVNVDFGGEYNGNPKLPANQSRRYLQKNTGSEYEFSKLDLDDDSYENLKNGIKLVDKYLSDANYAEDKEGIEAAKSLRKYLTDTIKDVEEEVTSGLSTEAEREEKFAKKNKTKLSEEESAEQEEARKAEQAAQEAIKRQEDLITATNENVTAERELTDAVVAATDVIEGKTKDESNNKDLDGIPGESSTAEHEQNKGKQWTTTYWDPDSSDPKKNPFGGTKETTGEGSNTENLGKKIGEGLGKAQEFFGGVSEAVSNSISEIFGEHPKEAETTNEESGTTKTVEKSVADVVNNPVNSEFYDGNPDGEYNVQADTVTVEGKETEISDQPAPMYDEPIGPPKPTESSSDITTDTVSGFLPDGTLMGFDEEAWERFIDTITMTHTVEGSEEESPSHVEMNADHVELSEGQQNSNEAINEWNRYQSELDRYNREHPQFQDWITASPDTTNETSALINDTEDLGKSQGNTAKETEGLSDATSELGDSASDASSAITDIAAAIVALFTSNEQQQVPSETPATTPVAQTPDSETPITIQDWTTAEPDTTPIQKIVEFTPDTTETDAARSEAEQPVEMPVEEVLVNEIAPPNPDPVVQEIQLQTVDNTGDTDIDLEDKNVDIDINANVTGQEETDALNASIEETDDKSVDIVAKVVGTLAVTALNLAIALVHGKSVSVSADVGNSISSVNQLINAINRLQNKTITVTTVNQTINKAQKVDGTAHAFGTAHAKGNWGIKDDEDALVNELGEEIIVRDGQWFTVNNGYPAITHLKRDDIVFNHKQSEALRKNGYITGSHGKMVGRSFAGGTAYSNGSSGFGVIAAEEFGKTAGEAIAKELNDVTGVGGIYRNGGSGEPTTPTVKPTTKKTDTPKTGSGSGGSGGGGGGNNNNTDSDKKKDPETFDWIERLLENLQKAIDNFDKMADTYSKYTEKLTEYTKESQKIQSAISKYTSAEKKYLDKADTYRTTKDAHGNVTTLITKDMEKKIQNGTMQIEEISNEKVAEAIKNYQTWYEKAEAAKETISDLNNQLHELSQKRFDAITSYFDAFIDRWGSAVDYVDSISDLREARYGAADPSARATAATYTQRQIKQMRKELATYEREYQRQIQKGGANGGIDAGSAEDQEAIKAMTDMKKAINEATTQLYEINQKKFEDINKQYEPTTNRWSSAVDYVNAQNEYYEALNGYGSDSFLNTSKTYLRRELESMQKHYDAYYQEYLNQNIPKGSPKDQEYIKNLTDMKKAMLEIDTKLLTIDDDVKDIAYQKFQDALHPYDVYHDYLSARSNRWQAQSEAWSIKNGRDSSNMIRKAALNENTRRVDLLEKQAAAEAELEKLRKSGVGPGTEQYTLAATELENIIAEVFKAEVAVNNLNKKILEINWHSWNQGLALLTHYQSTLNSIISLMDEFNSFDSKTALITDYGAATVNTYAMSMQEARNEVAAYRKALEQLEKEYKDGKRNATEYAQLYQQYYESELSAAQKVQSSRKAIVEMTRKQIEAETAVMQKLIDKRKEALRRQKEADDYARTVKNKNKEILKIQRQIAALSGDTTQATQAKILKLQAELAEKQEDLADTQRDHQYDVLTQGLEDEMTKYRETQDEKTEALMSSLEYQDKIIQDSFKVTTDHLESTVRTWLEVADEYGITIPEAITKNFGTITIDGKQVEFADVCQEILNNAQTYGISIKDAMNTAFGQIGMPDNVLSDITADFGKIEQRATDAAAAVENMNKQIKFGNTDFVYKNDINGNDAHADKDRQDTEIDSSQYKVQSKEEQTSSAYRSKIETARKDVATKFSVFKNAKDQYGDVTAEYNAATKEFNNLEKAYNNSYYKAKYNTKLRQSPDKNGTVLTNISKGEPLGYTGVSKNAYEYVIYKGLGGWVHRNDLETNIELTASQHDLISRADSIKSRYNTATTNYNKVNSIGKTYYDAVDKLNAEYSNIQTYGTAEDKAWAQKLQSYDKSAQSINYTKKASLKDYILTSAAVLRKQNRDDGEELIQLYKGDDVFATGKESGDWIQVTYGDSKGAHITGWIKKSYLTSRYGFESGMKSLTGFAKGTKSSPGGWALTDEEGVGTEAILTKKGVLRNLDAGAMVFNKAQKQNLWEMSKLNAASLLKNVSMANAGVTIQNTYGSLLTVNGNVDKDALPGLTTILDMAVEKMKKEMTTSMIRNGFAKR